MARDSCPAGWRLVRLGDLGEVNRGRSLHRPRYAEHLYGGPYPFIQTGDIRMSGGRITSHTQTYSDAGLAQSRLWPAGTMCITIAANIAETAILTYPACFPDSVVGFIADDEKCDVRFVEYMFRYLRRRIQHEATGSVQDNINLSTLDQLRFPLPTLAEQKSIAHILGTLDDKIELNRRTNETLEAMARAIFKSWFVDFDPVRANSEGRRPTGMDNATAALFPDSFTDSPMGKIPKGWRAGRLADVTSKIGSGATPLGGSQVYVDEGTAFIRSQNVHDYEFRWDGLARITEQAADDLRGVTVENGDVLINITGDSILRTCVVDPDVLPARVNQHVAIIRPAGPMVSRYLHLHLVRPEMKHFLMGFDAGGTRKAVTKGQLESAQILVPPAALLGQFRKMTDALYAKVERNRATGRVLAAIRDALLPKLLSGKIRVHTGRAIERVG